MCPHTTLIAIPVADGGEGTVDAFLTALGGEKRYKTVKGPHFEPVRAFYGLLPDGTAVIEMAAAAGLPLAEWNPHVETATTFGVGELMCEAARNGCRRLLLGLGGSATNDLGCGAACAAGVRFINGDGQPFLPTGETLSDIGQVDCSGLDPALKNVPITAMCDIDNPLYGPTGAAYVFAPQKGADEAMVIKLDRGLRDASVPIGQAAHTDITTLPGGGAAGGMGAGMVAFFGATLQPGIEAVLDTVGFDRLLPGTDMVYTGEGRIDAQSLRGKVVIGVARRAKKAHVPVTALVGAVGDGYEGAYDEGVSGIFSINLRPEDFSTARYRSEENLRHTIRNLLRYQTAPFGPVKQLNRQQKIPASSENRKKRGFSFTNDLFRQSYQGFGQFFFPGRNRQGNGGVGAFSQHFQFGHQFFQGCDVLANDLQRGIDENIGHIVVPGANPADKTEHGVRPADRVGIRIDQTSFVRNIIGQFQTFLDNDHVAAGFYHRFVGVFDQFFGFAGSFLADE